MHLLVALKIDAGYDTNGNRREKFIIWEVASSSYVIAACDTRADCKEFAEIKKLPIRILDSFIRVTPKEFKSWTKGKIL